MIERNTISKDLNWMPGRRGRVVELGPAENKSSAGADRARC